MKPKTKREIIIETSQAYTKETCSVIGIQCVYKDNKGNKCAVGRCLKDDSRMFHEGNNLPVRKLKDEL
jgi:hypothetical protein